jgi:putative glutamine amidotransferase
MRVTLSESDRTRSRSVMKPVIGITPSSQTDTLPHGTFERFYLTAAYVRAVAAAGGVAIVLPPQPDAAEALLDVIDGLILSGGPDIAPERYRDAALHEATYGIDSARDELELDLVYGALRREMPIFGICRGIQVLNVAMGGTLIQDAPSQHPGADAVGHRQYLRGLEAWQIGHDVDVVAPTLLPYDSTSSLGVNSLHHQAIRELALDLIPVAYSPDGLIEAVARAEDPDVFAVQWHPELMFESDATHLQPFRRLVTAATSRRLRLTVA